MKSFYFTFLILGLCLFSCKHQPVNIPHHSTNECDTLNVSYSTTVKPILLGNCYNCHSTYYATTTGALDLEDWSSLKNYLTYTYRGDSIYGSKFYHSIKQVGLIQPMPPAGKLTDCEISKIHSWIISGAPAN
ncbi:MAG: hypothetical protein NT084_04170 [Bacteroidetes bacterium]|nr:hypothetical protein [Bacteroidota bacterium]